MSLFVNEHKSNEMWFLLHVAPHLLDQLNEGIFIQANGPTIADGYYQFSLEYKALTEKILYIVEHWDILQLVNI